MPLEPIRTDAELQAAFGLLRRVFQADEGTTEVGERDALVTRIETYEHQQHEVGMADVAIAGLQDALAGRLLTGDELQQALTQVPRPSR
jgi:antitoxin component HigA of HigAB toxin-antitoxin module